MGIINDYMTGVTAPSAEQVTSRSLINSYLDAPDEVPTKVGTPKPPISGVSKEVSDELNRGSAKAGEVNPRAGIGSVPVKAAIKSYEALKEGAAEAASGVAEAFSGKPASGIGRTGMGLLSVVGSPFEGVGSVAEDLSGSPAIGHKASFIAGAVPVSKTAKIVNASRPKNKALNELVDSITSGGRDNQALVDTIAAMKADPRIGPVDTSYNVLNKTQDIFTREGDVAKAYLFRTSKDRVAKTADDVRNSFDQAGGIPVNVVEKLDALKAKAKETGATLINPPLANAKPVNISNTINEIDAVLKPGVWSKIDANSTLPLGKMKQDLADIKSYLANKKEMRTDANDLHEFQSSLRRTAEALIRKGGAEGNLGYAIMKVRNNLVDDIEASATGYKKGLAQYRDDMHINDAFGDGYYGVFSNSTKMENRPEFTKKWFDSLTDAEKDAAREGARLAIDSRMGAAQNPSLAGTNLGRSDFNQQKLEIIFGKEQTEKLLRDLENTRAIKNTDQKITEGSQTAMRMKGNEQNALPVKGEGGNVLNYALPVAGEYAVQAAMGQPGIGAMLGVASVAAKAATSNIKHAISTKIAKEKNAQFAKYALPTQGPDRDQLIRDLESFLPQPKQSIVRRTLNTLPMSP